MKENFFSKKVDKIKKGLIVGTATLATVLPMKDVYAQKKLDFNKNKTEIAMEKIKNIEAKTVAFGDFNPSPNKKTIKIEDEEINSYLTDNFSLTDLYAKKYNYYVKKENESKKIKISDIENFEKEILLVAKDLGYSKEDIEKLSANSLIMLSGKILSKKLSYHDKMIDTEVDNTRNKTDEISKFFSDAFNDKDMRNEEAKRIDTAPQDEIFSEGLGICRNYASVNMAVFEILKKINKENLNNTYMKWYSPNSLSEILSLPHAWNQVINVSEKNGKLILLITYVDPTWLDTRKTSYDNSGTESNISDEDLYNAFDVKHFFAGCLSAYEELAQLYEFLGECSDKERDTYLDLAYSERIRICEIALDSADIKQNSNISPLMHKKLFNKFRTSILASIANLQGMHTGATIPTFYDYREKNDRFKKEKLKEIEDLFSEARKVFYLLLNEKVAIDYISEEKERGEILFFDIDKMLKEN